MKTINIKVPREWHELDDKQLRYLFGLLADDYFSAEIRTLCLFCWSGLKVLWHYNFANAIQCLKHFGILGYFV